MALSYSDSVQLNIYRESAAAKRKGGYGIMVLSTGKSWAGTGMGGCCVTQQPCGLTGVLGPVTDGRQPVETGLKEDSLSGGPVPKWEGWLCPSHPG